MYASAANPKVIRRTTSPHAAGHARSQPRSSHAAAQVSRMAEPQTHHRCSCGGGCPKCSAGPAAVHEVMHSPGHPIDPATRGFMESRFGHDFSHVRLHTDAEAARSAADVRAHAFTVGDDVVFGSGEYAPGTSRGRALVAHELAHVVQQRGGRHGGASAAIPVHSEAPELEARRAAGAVNTGAPLPALSAQPRAISFAGWGEKWDAFWGVGPIDAYRAGQIADEALAAAQTTGLPGLHNGPADAWRHCFWNCRMTDSIGADQAETIATNHEIDNPGPILENMMDLHNNKQGRDCGGANCDACCQGKLDTAKLLVLDSKTGALVPSKATPRGSGTKSPVYKNY